MIRGVRTRKKVAAAIILILSFGALLSTYEAWRSAIQSQIEDRVNSMNILDLTCAFIIDNSWVMQYFNGRVAFIEGGTINKTELANVGEVWTSAATFRDHLLATLQPCKIFFGLTRTLFVLLGEVKEGPALRTTVNMYFTKYAPF